MKTISKNTKIYALILFCAFSVLNLFGCATVPVKTEFSAYTINGVTYFPLIPICEQRNIRWEYDTFSKTVNLSSNKHKVSLHVGDKLILVNGKAESLAHPVDIHQGTIVVPAQFKEQILDVIFKTPAVCLISDKFPDTVKKIVIDPGHGGNDPGAIGRSGIKEKYINLDISKRLAKLFRDAGVEVVMTRSSDVFISLPRRSVIANSAGADLFISIHSNANRVRSLKGFEVYYISPNVSDMKRAVASAEDSKLVLESACYLRPSFDLRTTLWDMIYTYNRGESIDLARSICKSIGRDLDTRVIGVKSAGFAVLKGTQIPAVLVEVGFLSNPEEERRLNNNYYRQQIAEAIVQGVRSYAHDSASREVN